MRGYEESSKAFDEAELTEKEKNKKSRIWNAGGVEKEGGD